MLTSSAPPVSPVGAPASGKRKFRLLWVLLAFLAAGMVLALLSPLLFNEKQNQSPSTASRPNTPPPKFRVFRQESGIPVSVIVAPEVTEEQLRSLLWLFRESVRERHFTQLGLRKPTGPNGTGFAAGMLEVFRNTKYANEPFTRKEGDPTHADAVFSWGLDRVIDHDEAFCNTADGNTIKVFDYSDNWQLPADEQRQVDEEKKVAARCTTDDPMAVLPAQGALDSWENGSSGARYWLGGFEKQHLFAVKQHELLGRYYVTDKGTADGQKPNSSAFKFRIESSTQGGFPITKEWYIDVTQENGECKVYKVEEAD